MLDLGKTGLQPDEQVLPAESDSIAFLAVGGLWKVQSEILQELVSAQPNVKVPITPKRASLLAQLVKNPPAMRETWV